MTNFHVQQLIQVKQYDYRDLSIFYVIFYLTNNKDHLIDSSCTLPMSDMISLEHQFELEQTSRHVKSNDYFLSPFSCLHAITTIYWFHDMLTNFTNIILNSFIQQ